MTPLPSARVSSNNVALTGLIGTVFAGDAMVGVAGGRVTVGMTSSVAVGKTVAVFVGAGRGVGAVSVLMIPGAMNISAPHSANATNTQMIPTMNSRRSPGFF